MPTFDLDVNVKFEQLFDVFPVLKPLFPFEWENSFAMRSELGMLVSDVIDNHLWVPALALTVYVLLIVLGPMYMKSREPFDFRYGLILWNLFLSVFSFWGAARTVPHLLYNIVWKGWYYSLCTNAYESYGQGACGIWTAMFIFSKIPELVDTFFIVSRKKPLIFLHWYHHITVLMFCWHSYYTRSSAGLYFTAMNFTVHAIMYFYYFLAACRIRVGWGIFVTMLQISQMAVGVGVCSYVAIIKYQHGLECFQTTGNYIAGIGMYASYFVLFLLFFLKRFVCPSSQKENAKKKKQ